MSALGSGPIDTPLCMRMENNVQPLANGDFATHLSAAEDVLSVNLKESIPL
jgi:hypothetical protein